MKRDPREVRGRRFYLGIFFRCCRVYQRIYRRPEGDRYVGFCPHCLRRVEVPVAPGGSEERIFQAD